jgi:hypothetical protein
MSLRRAFSILPVAALAMAASCVSDPVAAPPDLQRATSLKAKPVAGVSVTSTNPPFSDVGTTIDVHVFGSGFTEGAEATWLLHGVANAAKVRTNSTRFVSSSELVANITVSADADLAFWDVQVALIGGKHGVGSELHEITSARILGNGTIAGDSYVNAMTDQQQVVGYFTGGSSGAFVFDDAFGMLNLGGGQAWGIDPLGGIVLGRTSSFFASAWVRQADNRWTAEMMPAGASSLGGTATGAARADDGTLLVAGWETIPSGKKNDPSVNRPVLWRRSGNAWSPPTYLTMPSGATRAGGQDVNHLGQVVATVDGSSNLGAVWDIPAAPVRLDGAPSAINESGTLIVGRRGSVAVYWWRNAAGAWVTTGVPLPTLAGSGCSSGAAGGVNSAGVIVGNSCNASGKNQATEWKLDLSGSTPTLIGGPMALPGLGLKKTSVSDISNAAAVTESAPYVAAGTVLTNGTRLAVRWQLP